MRSATWQCRMSNAPARLTPLKAAVSSSSFASFLLRFPLALCSFLFSCQHILLQVLHALLVYAPYCSGSASYRIFYQSLLLRKPNTRIINCPSMTAALGRKRTRALRGFYSLAASSSRELSFTSLFSGSCGSWFPRSLPSMWYQYLPQLQ